MQNSPKIDNRSAQNIFHDVTEYLEKGLNINADGGDPTAEALLRVFARYCELIIQRLNKVPNKNHAAFLEILNISRIPPISAQVPLTFTPIKKLHGKTGSIMVPVRTQVSAARGEDEIDPAIFETTRDLVLTNIELKKVLALDPKADLFSDRSYLLNPEEGNEEEFVFDGKQPVAHELYLGHGPIFGKAGITTLHFYFEIEGTPSLASGRQEIDWWIPTENGEVSLIPARDTTSGLTQSGDVVFKDLPEWPLQEIFEHKTNWLGCRLRNRLQTRITTDREIPPKLPLISSIMISAIWDIKEYMIESAVFNTIPLDFSKDFFPFGERPRFGDVFYLKCDAFSKSQAKVAIIVKLTNPASVGKDAPIPPVNDKGEPVTQWEFWNGHRWVELACEDGTRAFIEDGVISFLVPSSILHTTVNGVEGYWVRVRLVSGNYGEDERFEYTIQDQEPHHFPSTLSPPSILSIDVTSVLKIRPEQPEQVIINNNFFFEQFNAVDSFQPFKLASDPHRALYLGFNFPDGEEKKLTKLSFDLYFHIPGALNRAFIRESTIRQRPELSWQCWNGSNWIEASVEDETESLTRSGIVSIRTDDNIAHWREFSIERNPFYWVKVLWISGQFECSPKLCGILVNTVVATQTTTIENELVGSSNGLPNQTFRTARVPILHELQLEIREPDMPSNDEYKQIYRQEEKDAIDVKMDRQGNIEQIWVRWQEVNDFLLSSSCDRHFVVDRQLGEIRFGNGIKGLIPPAAANNIRLRKYQIGGGLSGNKPAKSITQFRTSVPYVDSVVNLEPAYGGQDIEDQESMRKRGSRLLRHRHRAVTKEDYEDLARQALPIIAKAKCYPNCDLTQDPAGRVIKSGVVSLIVVPRSLAQRPTPDLNLLRYVANFINRCRVPSAELILLAPEYVRIIVEAVIIASAADTGTSVIRQCVQDMDQYLHPITGGDHGRGWKFGELPHESDFYARLEAIQGLEYVRSLNIRMEEERIGLLRSGIFLISAGKCRIRYEL